MPRIVRALLSVLLALNLLVPANVLQTLGWAGMLADRILRQDMGLVKAVEETFDGDHPCKFCKAAQTERERPSPATPAPSKDSDQQKMPEKYFPGGDALPAAGVASPADPALTFWAPPAGRGADPPATPPPITGA